MGGLPTVSVIVVSRDRPAELALCLTAVSQLLYDRFEIIVVADRAGLAAIPAPVAGRIKTVLFDEENISLARNAGIAEAGGDIVAFVDDDAVPEPAWLTRLCAPFSDERVSVCGGYVRGRDGIRFQCRAHCVDVFGISRPLEYDSDATLVVPADQAHAIGTNCAYRRSDLLEIGGFDENFHYHLDETDVNMRLAARGRYIAVCPHAEVHHRMAPNARRGRKDVPKSLFEVGASMAVFMHKYAPPDEVDAVWRAYYRDRHSKLVRATARRVLKAADVGRLMHSLHDGYKAGQQREITDMAPLESRGNPFVAFRRKDGQMETVVISGRGFQRYFKRKEARAQVAAGKNVSLFLFSPTGFSHRVRFHPDGYWEQRGGLFGRSGRSDPIYRIQLFQSRLEREINRVAKQRRL
jgi:GT2 family glycosyltransferase